MQGKPYRKIFITLRQKKATGKNTGGGCKHITRIPIYSEPRLLSQVSSFYQHLEVLIFHKREQAGWFLKTFKH
jgi:hypothetical protein